MHFRKYYYSSYCDKGDMYARHGDNHFQASNEHTKGCCKEANLECQILNSSERKVVCLDQKVVTEKLSYETPGIPPSEMVNCCKKIGTDWIADGDFMEKIHLKDCK